MTMDELNRAVNRLMDQLKAEREAYEKASSDSRGKARSGPPRTHGR